MAIKTIKTVIQLRRDTTANWETNKTVIPASGEPCFDTDLHTLRIGDGTTAYENLPVIGADSGADVDLTELWTAVNKKADSATTLAGYGITDALTATEVQNAIDTAIAASGTTPAAFEVADSVPSAADAEDGILYLVMNSNTGYYDIYAKVNDSVVRLDDTSVDLPGATMEKLGMVKGSDAENGVSINDDYTMTVNSINVNKLVQTDGDEFIIDGGSAS